MSDLLPKATPLGISNNLIEKFADHFREVFKFNPLNDSIFDLVEKLGCTIDFVRSSERDLQKLGTIEVQSSTKWIVFIPSHSSPLDDKFTLAHELGHYVLHSSFGEKPMRAFRRFKSNDSLNLEEIEADAFALALLMPRELVVEKINEFSGDTALIAATFDIDIESATQRLNWINSK